MRPDLMLVFKNKTAVTRILSSPIVDIKSIEPRQSLESIADLPS